MKEETYWDVFERLLPQDGDLLYVDGCAWFFRERGEGRGPYLERASPNVSTIWNNYLTGTAPAGLKLYRPV